MQVKQIPIHTFDRSRHKTAAAFPEVTAAIRGLKISEVKRKPHLFLDIVHKFGSAPASIRTDISS